MKRLFVLSALYAIASAQTVVLVRHRAAAAGGFSFVRYQEGTLTNGQATATVTFPTAVPAGHQVVFGVSACKDTPCSLISPAIGITTAPTGGIAPTGNGWIVGNGSANNTQVNAWLIPVTTPTTSFSVTYAAGMYWAAVSAAEFTGLATTTPFDQATAGGSTTAGTMATVTPSNTTNATDLIVGFISLYASNAVTPGTNFTEAGETTTGLEMEYRTTTSTGSYPCTWSYASTTFQAGCLAIKLQ